MLLIKYLSSFDLWLHHLLEMHGNLHLFCVRACVCSGGRVTHVSQKSWFKNGTSNIGVYLLLKYSHISHLIIREDRYYRLGFYHRIK